MNEFPWPITPLNAEKASLYIVCLVIRLEEIFYRFHEDIRFSKHTNATGGRLHVELLDKF